MRVARGRPDAPVLHEGLVEEHGQVVAEGGNAPDGEAGGGSHLLRLSLAHLRHVEGRGATSSPRWENRTANECLENRQMVRFLDITTEPTPFGVSSWTVPESSGNFCERGGRFGTHSSNENLTPIYYNRVLFVAHFNAGVRAIDVRDPMQPKEIGYYIPAITEKTDQRCVGTGADQRCKTAIQTNNVEVDDRGFIYIVDRANTGMHILQLTGTARQVAKF